jgi:glycosyltransferase involved in cell wall biosynthesis
MKNYKKISLVQNNLFFSIIIPTYNRALFIEKTIRSVLNQNYRNFEIIIVDDGSTDNTAEIIKNINSDKIKYFKIENSERGVARNYGIKHSTGDYVTFLDSDDILLPTHFTNASESILKYDRPPFLHLGYEIVNTDNKLLFKIDKLKNDNIYFLTRGNSLSCNGCFLRADVSRKFMFNEDRNLAGSEDWELWFRVLANYGIKTDNRISSRMYNHESRSVALSLGQEQKLVLRKELALKYAFKDPKVKERYGKYYNEIDAFGDSYIALHLALLGDKKRSMRYFIKFVKNYPAAIFTKRFFVIIKCMLSNPN